MRLKRQHIIFREDKYRVYYWEWFCLLTGAAKQEVNPYWFIFVSDGFFWQLLMHIILCMAYGTNGIFFAWCYNV